MPKVQSSSSFQDELRQSLLEKGQGTGGNVAKKNKTNDLFAGVLKFSQKHLSYYALTAATVIMVVALALLYNGGLVESGPGNDRLPDPYTAMIEQKKPAGQVQSGETFPSIIEEGPAVKPPAPGQETEPGETGTAGTGETPATPPGRDVPPTPGQPANEPEPEAGTEPKEDPDEPVPPAIQAETTAPETDFKVDQNLQSFKAAGRINLPPVFYRTTPAETAAPVEKINQAWKPRKTVFMLQSEARSIATPEWAREILTNEGFPVREGDTLESRLRETSSGALVEVSYLPRKGGLQELPVVLHYEEGKGIIAYYYQEDGKVLPPGFYALLSPAKAFEQVQGVEWYASSPRLDFSFQEVYLTYYDFPVGDHAASQKQRLPAYCFLGRETFNNGGELKLYLPAVP